MTAYRVYRLDGISRQTSAEWVEAKTDVEAVEDVKRAMGTSVRCEIWRGTRLVSRLEASKNNASSISD